jgi:hypothetical protein
MACKASKSKDGSLIYHIAKDQKQPELDAWWLRHDKKDELFTIRQENDVSGTKHVDLIQLTLGQVYDLIHALSAAVMNR